MKSELKKLYTKYLEIKQTIYNLSWNSAPFIWLQLIKINIKPNKNNYSNVSFGKEILILVSENYLSRPYDVQGADLTDAAKNWIEEKFQHQKTVITTLNNAKSSKTDILFITYDWLLSFVDSKNIYQVIFGAIRIATVLKKNYKHIWVALPDSYYLKINILIKILEIKSTILSIFILQNTRNELIKYGFKNIISPVFWTWPKNRQEAWVPKDNWANRDMKVLIAASGGCIKRLELGKKYIDIFKKRNYEIIETNFSLPWNEYIEVVKSARYIFTTCNLQEAYLTNSDVYNSKLSKYTITGRAWEALYVGAVLLTNNNYILNEMGFYPNVHFIDITELEIENLNQAHIENLFHIDKLRSIAQNGKKQLDFLLSTKTIDDLNYFSSLNA